MEVNSVFSGEKRFDDFRFFRNGRSWCRCGLSDMLSFRFPARDPTPSVCVCPRLIRPTDFDQINFVESRATCPNLRGARRFLLFPPRFRLPRPRARQPTYLSRESALLVSRALVQQQR